MRRFLGLLGSICILSVLGFPSLSQDIIIPDDIKGILDTSCKGCHAPGTINTKAQAKILDIFDITDIIRRGHIVPGNPQKSTFYTQVLSDQMPDGALTYEEAPVANEDKERLAAWISALKAPPGIARSFISDGQILG